MPVLSTPLRLLADGFLLVGGVIQVIGFWGPFLRKIIAACLGRIVAPTEGWVISRITESRVRTILDEIRQKMALLHPGLPPRDQSYRTAISAK
jgi:hypothetical protein